MKMPYFLKLCFSPSLVFFAAICFLVYYLVYTRHLQQWKASNIPFTRPFFLLGHKHFFKLLSNSFVVPLDMIYRDSEGEDLVGFFLAFFPVILIRDPNIIKDLYNKNFDKMFENGFSPVKSEVAYQSVIPLTSDRTLWKTGRNALAASFRTSKLETSDFGKFKKQIDRLWYHAEKSEQLGKPLDGHAAARNFVVDSINIWNFSEDANSWEKKTRLHHIVDSLFELTYQRLVSFIILILFPSLQFFNPLRFIRFDHIDSATDFLTETIEHRDQHQISHNDYIDHLMSLRKAEVSMNTPATNQNDKGIGVDEMAGYILSWSLAGSDTTAQLCLFTVHLLSLHPEYQDRIREELDKAMKKLHVSEITFQVVRELQFVEYCLLETSRLYPILPAIMRRCSEDFRIPGTKYELRKGDLLFTAPYSIHQDPRFFKDPHLFYPERFSPENRDSARLDMFIAFGTGTRKCPGYKIGVSLAAMFVASLLYKYEVRPRSHMKQMDATDFDPRGFTAQHTGKFLVDLVSRKSS